MKRELFLRAFHNMLVDFMEFKRLEDMVGNIIVCQSKLTFGNISKFSPNVKSVLVFFFFITPSSKTVSRFTHKYYVWLLNINQYNCRNIISNFVSRL